MWIKQTCASPLLVVGVLRGEFQCDSVISVVKNVSAVMRRVACEGKAVITNNRGRIMITKH